MKIVTLTLNPAFDVHCTVESLTLGREHLCTITDREAGGKGVNISRALTKNGIENLALVVLGAENGDDFCRRLESDGMRYLSLTLPGRIRENITIHPEVGEETRLSFAGFSVDESLPDMVEAAISPTLATGDVVTLTGRIPSGIGMESVIDFVERLQSKGVRVVIDSRSFTLDDLRRTRPFLIKPNAEEIAEYLGRKVSGAEDVREAARALHADGIENVMISLGEMGALLVCDEGEFLATPPSVTVLSTIGAGDSSIAGFLSALSEGLSCREALRRAVAFGTAACKSSGTRPPEPCDVTEIEGQVNMRELS